MDTIFWRDFPNKKKYLIEYDLRNTSTTRTFCVKSLCSQSCSDIQQQMDKMEILIRNEK